MCKPTVISRHIGGPGPWWITVDYFNTLCGAMSLPLSWGEKLGWGLRRIAQKIDGKITYSMHITGPTRMTDNEYADAMVFGVTAMQNYLNDLHRDGSIGNADLVDAKE